MERERISDLLFKSIDSSSVAVRATATSISNMFFDPFEMNPKLEFFAKFLSIFGSKVRIWLATSNLKNLGIEKSLIKHATVENAANWVVSQYKTQTNSKFNYMLIGAPSGAVSHFATLLKAPFLSQHFLLTIREKERNPDDIYRILKSGLDTAQKLNKINGKDIEIIIHYDPVHDRFLLKYLDTIRFKIRKLPQAYREFMLKHMEKEGTILFFDVKYMWKHYRVEDNITFQIGGLGGISPDEYLFGSERLRKWLHSQRSKVESWNLNNEYSLETYPESEWGTVDYLEKETKEFANENGFKFFKIHITHPEKVSEIVFNLFTELLKKTNKEINSFFFDCFTAINPLFNLQTSSVPIWLPFNCEDSFQFAKRMIKKINSIKTVENPKIFLTLVPSFTSTPDEVPLPRWISLLENISKNISLIGTSKKYYPYDTIYPFKYIKYIHKYSKKYHNPLQIKELSPKEINTLINKALKHSATDNI